VELPAELLVALRVVLRAELRGFLWVVLRGYRAWPRAALQVGAPLAGVPVVALLVDAAVVALVVAVAVAVVARATAHAQRLSMGNSLQISIRTTLKSLLPLY
jgi:hypothetical protein